MLMSMLYIVLFSLEINLQTFFMINSLLVLSIKCQKI